MKTKNQGFTLIVMLLIIALVAAVAVSQLASYQQRLLNIKIQKSALQIQEILKAATAYYANNQHWPQDCSAADFQNYLPNGVTINPWGQRYTCLSPSQLWFRVQITPLSTQIANRLITFLPNAWIDNNQMYVAISLSGNPPPLQGNVQITKIGLTPSLCDASLGCPSGVNGQTSYSFNVTCPANWKANLVTGISSITAKGTPGAADIIDNIYTVPFATLNSGSGSPNPGTFCTAITGTNNWLCKIQATATTAYSWDITNRPHYSNYGSVTFMYIAFCSRP